MAPSRDAPRRAHHEGQPPGPPSSGEVRESLMMGETATLRPLIDQPGRRPRLVVAALDGEKSLSKLCADYSRLERDRSCSPYGGISLIMRLSRSVSLFARFSRRNDAGFRGGAQSRPRCPRQPECAAPLVTTAGSAGFVQTLTMGTMALAATMTMPRDQLSTSTLVGRVCSAQADFCNFLAQQGQSVFYEAPEALIETHHFAEIRIAVQVNPAEGDQFPVVGNSLCDAGIDLGQPLHRCTDDFHLPLHAMEQQLVVLSVRKCPTAWPSANKMYQKCPGPLDLQTEILDGG
jgi:hypothetical protein